MNDQRQLRVDTAIAEYLESKDNRTPFAEAEWLDRFDDIRDELLAFVRDESLFGNRDLEETAAFAPNPNLSSSSVDRGSISSNRKATIELAGYRLIQCLGVGGMGEVYEAEDLSSHRVAIKVLSKKWNATAEALTRFKQEGAIASAINHPRCVFVKAADEINGIPFIVMELMTGRTLKDMAGNEKTLSVPDAMAKILDVLEGLEEAHEHGMIHRDIKPANCYLEPNGRVKLGDFGLARSILDDSSLTRTGTFVGTPLYASPEQIRGDNLDVRTDIYSVCATLYFLLTGQAPFDSSSPTAVIAKIVSEDPLPPRYLNPEIPPALEFVLLKGLKRNRSERFGTVRELIAALRPFSGSTPLIAQFGLRAAAYGIDFLILGLLAALYSLATLDNREQYIVPSLPFYLLVATLPTFLYCFVCEATWGGTVGKLLLGLRVVDRKTTNTAPIARIALRAFVYTLLVGTASDLICYWLLDRSDSLTFHLYQTIGFIVSYFVLLTPLAFTRGLFACHDLISGTMVVLSVFARKRNVMLGVASQWTPSLLPTTTTPVTIGPYMVLGSLGKSTESEILLAEDNNLDRKIWLLLRPASAPALAESRQRCDRTARLRWINGGVESDSRWDAFLAPTGAPLKHWAVPGECRDWSTVSRVLEQLLREFENSRLDGTSIPLRSLDQVWMDVRGRTCLLDLPLGIVSESQSTKEIGMDGGKGNLEREGGTSEAICTDQEVAVLRESARQLLIGRSFPLHAAPCRVDAIVPLHARTLLDSLSDSMAKRPAIGAAASSLRESLDRPVEIGVFTKLSAVGIAIVSMSLFFGAMVTLSRIGNQVGLRHLRDELFRNQALQFVVGDPAAYHKFTNSLPASDVSRIDQEELAKVAKQFQIRLQETYKQRMVVASDIGRKLEEVDRAFDPLESSQSIVFQLRDQDTFALDAVNHSKSPKLDASALMRTAKNALNQEVLHFGSRAASTRFWIPLVPSIAVVLWVTLSRGGLPMRLIGIRLVDGRGRPASIGLHCARAGITWIPILVLLGILSWADIYRPDLTGLILVVSQLLLYLPLLYIVLALISPRRGLHDRLLGTWLVP